MTLKLSPLEYLCYRVPVQPPGEEWRRQLQCDDRPVQPVERLVRQMQNSSVGWGNAIRAALRSRRFEPLDSDPIVTLPGVSVERKYLMPALTALNTRLLRPNIPKLQFAEIPRQAWRTFIIGFWEENTNSSAFFDTPWHSEQLDIPGGINWEKPPKVALCIITFLPPRSLQPEYFKRHSMRQPTSMPLPVSREIDRLSEFCKTFNSPIGLLTDETLSVALDMVRGLKYLDDNPTPPLEVLSVDVYPVQLALAGLLHQQGRWMEVLYDGYRPIRLCLGAMIEHAPTVSSLREAFSSRHSFSDWDLFAMQRSREEWELFKRWKNATQALAEVQALEVGDTLNVKAQSAFGNRHFLMRSPYPKVPLPAETLSIIKVQSRPRNNNVDIILVDSDQDVTFAISAVKRSGVRAFSQVVIGTLGDNETKLCLKLYDERLFPIDAADDYDDRECREPSDRLNNLQFATDLARTEEAVYDRLDDLQGSMIPHFYGIHQVGLPDGTILWGLLTEFIDCLTLQHVDASVWPKEAQIDFIRRMRHSFRALRYAGVLHNDEEARNVLCPDIGEKGFGALGIVIIDFAHSKLWLHDDNGTPPTYWSPRISPHWRPLLISARISEELVEEHWEPLNEIEF